MSKAVEMFEKLGYEMHEEETEIKYIRKGTYVNGFIKFDLTDKVICAEMGYNYESKDLTMQELQAINEKVKELGWNE